MRSELIDLRKKRVSTQTAELEALQARLQEIEAKLKETQSGESSPSGEPESEQLQGWASAKEIPDTPRTQPRRGSPPSPRQ